jgi:hypothetical protein
LSEEKNSVERAADVGERIFRLLRDAAIGAVLVLLIAFPRVVNNRLRDAGFTMISPQGITWQAQVKAANETTKTAAMTVASVNQTLDDAHETLTQIQNQTNDPKVKAAVSQLTEQITRTQGQVQQADTSIKETVLTQQTLLAQSNAATGADASSSTGWLFIGRVNEDQKGWAADSPVNIHPVNYPLQTGQQLTIAGENYLRADSTTKQHRDGRILTVLRGGTQVHVIKVDPTSHALAGGWFVWVQVST